MDRSLADRLIVLQVREYGDDDQAVTAAAAHLGIPVERVQAALERESKLTVPVDEDGYPTGVHHRHADLREKSCEACAYFAAGRCEMFDLPTAADDTCDAWSATR